MTVDRKSRAQHLSLVRAIRGVLCLGSTEDARCESTLRLLGMYLLAKMAMTTNVRETDHSTRRKAQRGISDAQIDLVRMHGRSVFQPGGRSLYFMGKMECGRLKAVGINADGCANLAIVFGPDGFLITTFRSPDFRRARLHGTRLQR
ncbi:MAG: hypothetical protein H0U74_19180 [Bradymonadaceae bacterium]|nr:hypothetical protein [Lujinxingiaceae bacterium]